MGEELTDHAKRLAKSEEFQSNISTSIRQWKWLVGLLASFVTGQVAVDCNEKQEDRIQLRALSQAVQYHAEKPHPKNEVTEETIESMQQIDKEHDDRLKMVERKLKIRGR